MPSSPEQRVLIIGAGVTGLLIAQSFRKLGIACTVFERDASLDARPRDWNFSLHWANTVLKDCLPDDLSLEIIRQQAAVDEHIPGPDEVLPLINLASGEVMARIPTPLMLRLQKQRLRNVLRKGVDVKFAKRLVSLHSDGSTATVVFEDGTKEEGRLVIGADGAHSKVRDFLLGPEKATTQASPIVACRMLASLPEEAALQLRSLHPRNLMAIGPRGVMVWMSAHNCRDVDPSKWTYTLAQSWLPSVETAKANNEPVQLDNPVQEEIIQIMKQRAQHFAEPLKSIWSSIPADSPVFYSPLNSWCTEVWDNHGGTVTLAGDAAHAMTFHRGQGLNNAVQDVATLVSSLQQHPPTLKGFKDALAIYEPEVFERGREAVLSSNQNSEALMNWDSVKQSLLYRKGLENNVH